jgi:hypothetical protein
MRIVKINLRSLLLVLLSFCSFTAGHWQPKQANCINPAAMLTAHDCAIATSKLIASLEFFLRRLSIDTNQPFQLLHESHMSTFTPYVLRLPLMHVHESCQVTVTMTGRLQPEVDTYNGIKSDLDVIFRQCVQGGGLGGFLTQNALIFIYSNVRG